jgi:hypothetical protein
MRTWEQAQTEIKAAISKFPNTFGLRAFPGKVFRLSEASSYFSDETLYLYTEVQDRDSWLSFGKGTVSEVSSQIVQLPKLTPEQSKRVYLVRLYIQRMRSRARKAYAQDYLDFLEDRYHVGLSEPIASAYDIHPLSVATSIEMRVRAILEGKDSK